MKEPPKNPYKSHRQFAFGYGKRAPAPLSDKIVVQVDRETKVTIGRAAFSRRQTIAALMREAINDIIARRE